MVRRTVVIVAVVTSIVGVGFIGRRPLAADATPRGVEPVRTIAAASTPKPSGVEVVGALSANNSDDLRTVAVTCAEGKKATGGGAVIWNSREKVVLTNVSPFGAGRGYVAAAAETTAGATHDWQLQVLATCANPMPGYQIVIGPSEQASSSALQSAIARCPSTKRVMGTGAAIHLATSDPVRNALPAADKGLVLQVMRASGPGDITRAQAREAPGGYAGGWHLTAYAICADTPPGYEVLYGDESPDGNQPAKVSTTECPTYIVDIGSWPSHILVSRRKQLLGLGATVDPQQPGNIALFMVDELAIEDGPYNARAYAADTSHSARSWGTVSAQAICTY